MFDKIKNLPAYAFEYHYIVVSVWKEELWFYGAYETESRAQEVAQEISGIVITH